MVHDGIILNDFSTSILWWMHSTFLKCSIKYCCLFVIYLVHFLHVTLQAEFNLFSGLYEYSQVTSTLSFKISEPEFLQFLDEVSQLYRGIKMSLLQCNSRGRTHDYSKF